MILLFFQVNYNCPIPSIAQILLSSKKGKELTSRFDMTVSRFSIPRVQDLLRRVSRPSELVNTYRSHTTSIKTFLTRLPPEFRIMVYEFVFVDMEERRCPHPLLKVSRLVRHESIPVLLKHFQLDIESWTWFSPAMWITTLRPLGYYSTSKSHYLRHVYIEGILENLLPHIRSYSIRHTTRRTFMAACAMVYFDRNSRVQPNNFKVLLNKIEYDSTVRGNSDGSEVEEYSKKFKDELGVSGECSVELLANLLHRLND